MYSFGGADLERAPPRRRQDQAREQGPWDGQTRLAETCSCGYTRLGDTTRLTGLRSEQEYTKQDGAGQVCVSDSITEGSKLVEGCVCTPGSADGHSILVGHDSRGMSIQGFCVGDPSSLRTSHYTLQLHYWLHAACKPPSQACLSCLSGGKVEVVVMMQPLMVVVAIILAVAIISGSVLLFLQACRQPCGIVVYDPVIDEHEDPFVGEQYHGSYPCPSGSWLAVVVVIVWANCVWARLSASCEVRKDQKDQVTSQPSSALTKFDQIYRLHLGSKLLGPESQANLPPRCALPACWVRQGSDTVLPTRMHSMHAPHFTCDVDVSLMYPRHPY